MSPAVVLMVCVSRADGIVSSLGHQPSPTLKHTSSVTHAPELTSALALESPLLTLTSPKHITQCYLTQRQHYYVLYVLLWSHPARRGPAFPNVILAAVLHFYTHPVNTTIP